MTAKTKPLGGRPTRERAAEIGVAVVKATVEAFSTDGNEFSMDQVAKLAGVSKQAIYRRWDSKFDLLSQSIDSLLDDGLQQPVPAHDDPVRALRDLLWSHFDKDVVMAHRTATFLRVEGLRDDRISTRMLQWRERFLTLYVRYLEAIDACGSRADGDVYVQAEILGELMNGGSDKLAMTRKISERDKAEVFEQRWSAFRRIALK
jgi:AcrR family transcriptional regulator